MTATNSLLRTFASWHLPAIVFFMSGLLAGIAFAVAGPVVAIRTLGGLAAVSALFGMATVAYAVRLENPPFVDAWHAMADSLRSAIIAWRREWADRVRRVDRHLQNAIWSTMG